MMVDASGVPIATGNEEKNVVGHGDKTTVPGDLQPTKHDKFHESVQFVHRHGREPSALGVSRAEAMAHPNLVGLLPSGPDEHQGTYMVQDRDRLREQRTYGPVRPGGSHAYFEPPSPPDF